MFGIRGRQGPSSNRGRQGPSMGCSPEPCEVCLNEFDHSLQRPRTLPCGHTFCGLCVSTLTQGSIVACPSCRSRHAVPLGGQFPVNYKLESMIRTQSNAQVTVGLSSKTRSLLKDQETKITREITTGQQVCSQLDQYETSLKGWGSQQQILEGKLQKVLDYNRRTKGLVEKEKLRMASKKMDMQQGQQQLCAALEKIRKVAIEKDAGTAFLDSTHCLEEAQIKAEDCLGVLTDDNACLTKEIMEASEEALASIHRLEAIFEALLSKAPLVDNVVGGRRTARVARNTFDTECISSVAHILAQQLHIQHHFKAEDVLNFNQSTQSLMEAGLLFAVHQVKGQKQNARITVSGCSVYLHTLRDQTLPPGATTMQMSEFLPLLPPCLVFMELSWPGTAPRQVRIRFSNDSPRARQFVLLCTGQWGHSYMGTKLWAVEDKGRQVERVKGGDYENDNGRGGAALLSDHDEGNYQNSVRAGSVWACGWSDPARGAQFAISTRERMDGCKWPGVFGEVVHGLDVIAAAARHHNIKEVAVVDCGVVLKE